MLETEIDLILAAKQRAGITGRKLNKGEAIQLLLDNPNLISPVCYYLVAYETKIVDEFPYKKYCSMMKEKAVETNNKALLKLVKACEKGI